MNDISMGGTIKYKRMVPHKYDHASSRTTWVRDPQGHASCQIPQHGGFIGRATRLEGVGDKLRVNTRFNYKEPDSREYI